MAKAKSQNPIFKHPIFIAVVAFVFLFAIFWQFIPKNNQIEVQNLSETATVTKNADGTKTYTDPDGYFSFNYPDNWNISFSSNNEGEYAKLNSLEVRKRQDIKVSGKEGSVEIVWVDSYGGGCGDEFGNSLWEKIKFNGELEDFCDVKDSPEKGQESWGNAGFELDTKTHLGILPFFIANSPYSTNRDTVLKILSSFKFTNLDTTPTCTPRPSCLDNPTSMCDPMEPAGGWCPK